jgi:CBS domain-containing protein
MSEMTVQDLMTKEVVTLKRNDELALADQIMALGRIRHLPIVDDEDGSLVGIVSQRDLFRSGVLQALGYGTVAEEKLMKAIRIKEVMNPSVETVSPETPVREAAKTMLTEKIGCLPVVDGEALVGILTEADFVRLFAEG